MKYLAVLTLGILTGLAFQHLPRRPLFNDLPPTPADWKPKMTGSWTDEEIAKTTNRFFNGGVE